MNADDVGSIRVLLVVGDETTGTRVAARLGEEGFVDSVAVETSPTAALDRLAGVDCVVSELALPEMDGLSFLRAVHEVDETLPFVLAPASGSEAIAADAIAAGATAYHPRPEGEFRTAALARRVANAVETTATAGRTAEMERVLAVIKDVDAALVRAETRSEIERSVCDIFADSGPYKFAWIGAYDESEHSLTPRAHAGVGDGFLEQLPVGDGKRLPDEGPGPRALETGDLQVTQNVHDDRAFDEYRDAVDDRGFRSVATVPLAHDDRTYGLLAVYADRIDAFDARERDLLSSVGTDIGHAIDALEARTDLRRFRQAVESAGQAIGVTSADGTIEYVNSTFEAQSGYERAAVVGRKLGDVIDVGPEAVEVGEDVAPGDLGWDRSFVATTRDGDEYHVEQTITPIVDDGEQLDGFVFVQADVTDRIEREKALRTETETLNSLFETSPIGIVVLSPDGEIRRANDRAASVLQTDVATIVGKTYEEPEWTFVDEDGNPLPEAEHPFYRVAADGEPIYGEEVRMARPHADPIWISVHGGPLVGPDGDLDGLVFTFDDVTESKERERELRSFEMAVEHAAHCIYVTDVDGTIEWVNPAFVSQTGYAREEAIGETPSILNSGVHDDAFFEEMWKTLLSGSVWESEIVNERKDGTHVHVDQSIAPVVDEDGEIERFVAINQDVTDRKEYQLRLERQNERLEEFASVVSHDLRNPLNVASGRLDLTPADDEHVRAAEGALERMESIIDDVLTLARDGTAVEETEPIDLEATVGDAWRTVPAADADLDVGSLPAVVADEGRVRRILENLFRNSIEHGGSDVTVRVESIEDGFSVEDTGQGIPEEARDRVFESGYTRSDSGTGLGLAIVRQLAQAHGWSVSLATGADGGARFEFTGLDVADAESVRR
ncbi:MAG: PAS domain S-box protein [Halanaeroarchaeum sp.]